MTEREKELDRLLASLVQKNQREQEAREKFEDAELAYVTGSVSKLEDSDDRRKALADARAEWKLERGLARVVTDEAFEFLYKQKAQAAA